MKNPYDVSIEFVRTREEVVTIDASNSDDAIAEAYEWAERHAEDDEEIRIVATSVNMEY